MINSSTELYAVFGNPIVHSMGPAMHNLAFQVSGMNAVYLAFQINSIEAGVNSIRELGIKGVSITIPFKETVIPFLDEIGDQARQMGSVNTIVNRNGRLCGYNTDYKGALEPLLEITPIKGRNVCILGAGGAAKAVAFGMRKEQAVITIANRSEDKGRALAAQMGADFVSIYDISDLKPDILINTTCIGMLPNIEESPVKADFLHRHMIVMDIVYNPIRTRLIQAAEAAGCTVVDGLSMFVNQGAAQYKLFTGLEAPRHLMREAVIKAMTI